jgi:hypothetical protein
MFQDGFDDGIKSFCDPAKQSDREYLDGVATGILTYWYFINSTEDHVGIEPSIPLGNTEELQLNVALRHRRSRLLKQATRPGHIPWAIPDLSDLEGTTDREDDHPVH